MKDRYCLTCNSLCEWLEIGTHRVPGRKYSNIIVESICPTCRVQPTAYWEEPTETAQVHTVRSLYIEVVHLRELVKNVGEFWKKEHWCYGEFKHSTKFADVVQACAKVAGIKDED